MKNALIIGIDSTIGSSLRMELLAAGWQVYGTSRGNANSQRRTFFLDLLNVKEFSFEQTVDVVFLCASITKMASCRDYPDHCKKINIDAQIILTEYFLSKGARVVFLSTSAVFNGEKPAYEVNDVPCPTTIYGESKVLAEARLLSMSDDISIVRMTKVLTPNYPLIQQWINQLKLGVVIEPFYDLHVCPISIRIVTACLKIIANKKLAGILHLSGDVDVSYKVLAEHLANVMGVSHSLIKSKSALISGVLPTEAPFYTSLNMTESRKLFDIPNVGLTETLTDLYGSQLNEV